MSRLQEIARDISIIMPKIARRVVFDFFQSVEISQTQIFTIMILYEKGSCRFSQLRQALRVSAPTATGIVDRLEKGGYARRVHDREDRRAVNVQLTPKGIKIAKQLGHVIQSRWKMLLSKLSREDAEDYLRILKKIENSLSE